MTDIIEAACKAWREADNDRWTFAELAAQIVGTGKTQELADRLTVSISTVYSYATAWRFFELSLLRTPLRSEYWRDGLYISHYIAIGKKWEAGVLEDDEALIFLQRSLSEGLSVDDLRKRLPSISGGREFGDVSNSAVKVALELATMPRLNVDENYGAAVADAARNLQAVIAAPPRPVWVCKVEALAGMPDDAPEEVREWAAQGRELLKRFTEAG